MRNHGSFIREFLRHPAKTSVDLGNLFVLCRTLSYATASSLWPNFRRSMHLRFVRRFSLEEIDELAMCVEPYFSTYIPQSLNRKEMTKVQESLNPPQYAPFLKNKALFYQYCREIGIAVPKCFAVYYKDGRGWTADKRMLEGAREWEEFLASIPCETIVIKPSPGCGGRGLMVYRRKGGMFCDLRGTTFPAAKVFEYIANCGTEDCIIIQEYLYNHPDIAAMSNVDGRQCARLATFVDARGCCHVIGAYFKIIVGGKDFDNFNYGKSGNIVADIDVDTGILRAAISIETHTRRIYAVDKHPETHKPIVGVRLPHWEAACALARRAALTFLPVRTVCWDMIVGPDGPGIVEGNIWWDPGVFNIFGKMHSMVERMNGHIQG
jgi:hypothetical protein